MLIVMCAVHVAQMCTSARVCIVCQGANLLPATSMNLMAIPIDGSINKVTRALIRMDDEVLLIPRFERRTPTPACSRI